MALSTHEKIKNLLDRGTITQEKVARGKGFRNVLIIDGKQYQYNDKSISKLLEIKVSSIYIDMPASSSNENENKSNEEILIEKLKKINNKEIDEVEISLGGVKVKKALTLIKRYVHDSKLGIKTEVDDIFFLNDVVMNKFIKGKGEYLISHTAIFSKGSDPEFLYVAKNTHFTLFRVESKTNRNRPSGGFFKYLNNTHFDFDRYGIHKEVKKENYNENCLYIALKYGGMEVIKLEKLKSFVINRIIPKCKLKEVCDKLEITIKLSILRNGLSTRIEHYGDKDLEEKI